MEYSLPLCKFHIAVNAYSFQINKKTFDAKNKTGTITTKET